MKPALPNPWRHLEQNWPDVSVRFEDIGRMRGFTTWPADGGPPYITLNTRLSQVQRRCTLAHETRHLERGMPCDGWRDQDERRVRAAAARWLLPVIGIVATALSVADVFGAAETLWVTVPVLMDRLHYQTAAEHLVMLELQVQQEAG